MKKILTYVALYLIGLVFIYALTSFYFKSENMPTRISFSTHYPDRMKELAGKPTRFPEKIIKGIDPYRWDLGYWMHWKLEYGIIDYERLDAQTALTLHPKTTTIRKNYDYWKSKEGQLIQPFFWAGKPRRSKHVVFCPAVLLARVKSIIIIRPSEYIGVYMSDEKGYEMPFYLFDARAGESYGDQDMKKLIQKEGFDHPDHFWMWFDQDFEGCLLEFGKAER